MLKAATNFFKPTQECPEVALEPRRNLSNDICIVACGDFSGLQQRFQELQGVDRVVVGYTGGKKEKPTSDKLHGHCEALFIEFQPNVISYRQILDEWKQCGDPWEPEKSQYRSALFWKSLPQQNIAFQFVEELQSEHPGKKLYTEVERIHKFYMAKQPCQLVELMPKAEGNEIAVVACGSFLGPQQRFQELGGVERVIMGYTGGKKDNPKNHKPYDHSEALLIEFNPTVLSYHRILELWSELDDPFTEDERQYHQPSFGRHLVNRIQQFNSLNDFKLIILPNSSILMWNECTSFMK